MKRLITMGAVAALALVAGCERPPVTTVQYGYRGTGSELVYNPRTLEKTYAQHQLPALSFPAAPAGEEGGPNVTQVYQNVQVLKDLNVAEFTRVMLSITAWVAPPDKSCSYCHVDGEPMSADTLYTKKVARKMLEMTRHVNSKWQTHVKATGVTCYTCHAGNAVPQYTWFTDPGPRPETGFIATRAGQNVPSPATGLTTLPYDPFTPYLLEAYPIRVQGPSALPSGNKHSIKETEWTYSLMVHMSRSLGVGCEFCHNSRSWQDWGQSTPQRATAWYGIRMARELNNAYLVPLTSTFPAYRLGPLGDVAKVNCSTCHRGAYKPLFGVSMAKDYPELQGAKPMPAAAPAADGAAAPAGAAVPTTAAATAPAAAPAKAM
jgi:photosynthetic reaction center cytochrome c subunit